MNSCISSMNINTSSRVLVVLGRVKQKSKISLFGKQKKKSFYGRRQICMKWLLGTMFYMLEQGFDDDDDDNILYTGTKFIR